MMRALIILLLGMAAGGITYVGYVRALSGPETTRLTDELQWTAALLELTPEQKAQLVDIHHEYLPLLSQQQASLRRYNLLQNDFERLRVTSDTIDFFALKDLLDGHSMVRQEAAATTNALIQDVLDELTPEQRRRYLDLVRDTVALRNSEPGLIDDL